MPGLYGLEKEFIITSKERIPVLAEVEGNSRITAVEKIQQNIFKNNDKFVYRGLRTELEEINGGLNILKVYKDDKYIGEIIHDGLSYMPEIVTACGSSDLAPKWLSDIAFLLQFGTHKLGYVLSHKQLAHVLDVGDPETGFEDIKVEPALENGYYQDVVGSLIHRGKELHKMNTSEIQNLWIKYCPGIPCPTCLWDMKEIFEEKKLAKRGLGLAVGTSSIHAHASRGGTGGTIDLYIDMAYNEGLLKKKFGEDYYRYMYKSKERHIGFGAIVAVRYLITKISQEYLLENSNRHVDKKYEKPDIDKFDDMLRPHHLLGPENWVAAPLTMGFDVKGSETCRIYEMIEELKFGAQIEEVRGVVLDIVLETYFNKEDRMRVRECYKNNTNLPVDIKIKRGHGDTVLKMPVPGILTMELRASDFKDPSEETEETFDFERNQQPRKVIDFIEKIEGCVQRILKINDDSKITTN